MATGRSFLPTMHLPSHCSSWGQTRPQTAGRAFLSQSLAVAPEKSPSAMHLMNSGMSTDTGHPSTQDGFLHCKHRLASVIAISSVSPSGTSSKFLRLTSGSCSGILTRSIFSFFAIYSSVQLTGCMFMRCFFQRFPCWFFLRPDRTPVVWPARQNPLCVRQIPDRPHRRTWYLRPRIRGSTRTCRFRRP